MGNPGKIDSGSLDTLEKFTRQAGRILKETRGPREALLGQLEEVLKTGGADAQVPVIQRAIEASQQSAAGTVANTERQLAQSGAAGTPFARRLLAQQRLQGEQASGQVGSQVAQQFLQLGLPALTQLSSLGLSSLQGASGQELEKSIFNANQRAVALDSIGSNSSSAAGAAACCASGTFIQTAKRGWVPIEDLMAGELIVSLDKDGRQVDARILATSILPVRSDHEFSIIAHGQSPRSIYVSPNHPIGGRPAADYATKKTRAADIGVMTTHDIRVDSASGEYRVFPGVWMQSTLDVRHGLHKKAA